ncbi:MAG: MoaD/ThiS family protein [ANME-2 cluster archaeon]|nr:MoaD/ThiS family protein [ANME-2 cluster archaeon]MDF1557556.1 MoaD/ThiS family protein [ANME-2 cluster archaeon]
MVKVKVLSGAVFEQSMEVEGGSTYGDVLGELELNPETVIVMVDGIPVPVDEVVSAGYLEVLRIVSGG